MASRWRVPAHRDTSRHGPKTLAALAKSRRYTVKNQLVSQGRQLVVLRWACRFAQKLQHLCRSPGGDRQSTVMSARLVRNCGVSTAASELLQLSARATAARICSLYQQLPPTSQSPDPSGSGFCSNNAIPRARGSAYGRRPSALCE